MQHEELKSWRSQLDAIDAQLVQLLAERFAITDKIGQYKAEHKLPAVDKSREAEITERIARHASAAGLDPELAVRIQQKIIAEVVARHRQLPN